MEKKMKNKWVASLCCLSAMFAAASCQNGFHDNESFTAGVTSTQLQSPEIDDNSFVVQTNPDGSESIVVSWDVVYGADGYLCNVLCTDHPEDDAVTPDNPLVVVQDSLVDGCKVAFPKIEDAQYTFSLKTIGDKRFNNTDAEEATVWGYSAVIPAVTIPADTELSAYINDNLTDSDKEQGFALEAGRTYYLNGAIDFGLNVVTLRSTDKNAARPTVVLGPEGTITTQAGLKVKFINFDCSESTQTGFITLSNNPDPSISTKSLGYTTNDAGFIVEKPVVISECNFRNLHNSLVYGGKKTWALRDLRIMNCIVQLDNEAGAPVLNLQDADQNQGMFKTLMIKKSTFYNIKKNGKTWFLRYKNASGSQPKKMFGDKEKDGYIIFENNTFYQTMTGKDFANNVQNTGDYHATWHNNIFYDCYRLNKFIQSNMDRVTSGNILFAVTKTDSMDSDLKNTNGTKEDPGFAGLLDQPLDLSQAKGGVNFTPSGAQTVANKAGDPRWYE